MFNRLHDLGATFQDHPDTGNSPDFTMRAGKQQASMPLIRRYNRHSEAVLQRIKPAEFKNAHERDRAYHKEIVLDDLEDSDSIDVLALSISDPKQYFQVDQEDDLDEALYSTPWQSNLSNVCLI